MFEFEIPAFSDFEIFECLEILISGFLDLSEFGFRYSYLRICCFQDVRIADVWHFTFLNSKCLVWVLLDFQIWDIWISGNVEVSNPPRPAWPQGV